MDPPWNGRELRSPYGLPSFSAVPRRPSLTGDVTLNIGGQFWVSGGGQFSVVISKGNPFLAVQFSETIDEGIVNWEQLLEGYRDFESSGVFDTDDMPIPVEGAPPDPIIERVAFVNDQLLERLKNDPKLMHGLSPRKFEELVAELLYQQGFEVELTPASRDGGFDIYAAKIESIGKFLYLVECKRYTPPKKVGVQVIRSLHGVVQKERANAGIVVTSSYFTSDAKELQFELEYQIKLSDYIGVQKLLKLI